MVKSVRAAGWLDMYIYDMQARKAEQLMITLLGKAAAVSCRFVLSLRALGPPYRYIC